MNLGRMPRQRRPYLSVMATVVGFSALYFLFFVRQFIRGDIVMGGDTQLLWSLNYLFFFSLKEFGEFLWWDPTAINGWPAYVNLTSGWFNYLGPYTLPTLIFFSLANLFGEVDINVFLVIQKTLYYFMLNLLAVVLISREVIKTSLARLLPPLIFTLSAIQFHGFRDSVLYEALPAPLFYVFALVYYNNRRTPDALITLFLFTALFVASLNYGVLQTSLWWATTFTFFLVLFDCSILRVTSNNLQKIWLAPQMRSQLIGVLVMALLALGAFYATVHFNIGELVRVPPNDVINYEIGVGGNFRSNGIATGYGMFSHPIWTNLLYWAPFEVIHDRFLAFDGQGGGGKSGVDHRYIGLVTLPLLLVAILRGYRNKYALIFLLSAFTCIAFVTYTYRNLLISSIAEIWPLFRNIRTVAQTLPRDGPIVFLALASGIGLDFLLKDKAELLRRPLSVIDVLLYALLGALLLFAGYCLAESLTVISPQEKTDIAQLFRLKEAFSHIGIYLSLFVILTVLLLRVSVSRNLRALGIVLLALVFFDLTISSSAYWQRGLVWFDNKGPHALPKLEKFGPVNSTLETWPGSYAGFIHNPYEGPMIGLRSWLVLETRSAWQPVLANWDVPLRMIRAYPEFKFFNGGQYIPFEKIKSIDGLLPPRDGAAPPYVHDKELESRQPKAISARTKLIKFTPNQVVVNITMPEAGILVFFDNFDRFWSARVDGVETPVYRANFTYKAISLPSGEHNIAFQYNPFIVKILWAAFYCTLAVVGIILCGVNWRRAFIFGIVFLGSISLISAASEFYFSDRAGNATVSLDSKSNLLGYGAERRLQFEGKDYPISERLAGYVEGVFEGETGMTKIVGWGIDEIARQPPVAVVATIGGRVWASTQPAIERPDIAAMSPGYLYSGFNLYGRGVLKRNLDKLQVFALLADGKAVELRYSEGVKHLTQKE